MALRTIGTNATTSLSGLIWQPGGLLPADIGALNALINSLNAPVPAPFRAPAYRTHFNPGTGQLELPGHPEAVLNLKPGDFVGVDAYGWPVIVSAQALAYTSTSWTHT